MAPMDPKHYSLPDVWVTCAFGTCVFVVTVATAGCVNPAAVVQTLAPSETPQIFNVTATPRMPVATATVPRTPTPEASPTPSPTNTPEKVMVGGTDFYHAGYSFTGYIHEGIRQYTLPKEVLDFIKSLYSPTGGSGSESSKTDRVSPAYFEWLASEGKLPKYDDGTQMEWTDRIFVDGSPADSLLVLLIYYGHVDGWDIYGCPREKGIDFIVSQIDPILDVTYGTVEYLPAAWKTKTPGLKEVVRFLKEQNLKMEELRRVLGEREKENPVLLADIRQPMNSRGEDIDGAWERLRDHQPFPTFFEPGSKRYHIYIHYFYTPAD